MTDQLATSSAPTRGLFIVLEGTEGSGKSTQVNKLVNWLRRLDHEVVVTREPGGTPVAEKLRDIIKYTEEPLCTETELLLLMAARRQHLDQVVRPALQQGKVVLCDRYLLSTLVYQGLERGYPLHEITHLHHRFCHGILPDLTVLLDISPETSVRRLKLRLQDPAIRDRFDSAKEMLPRITGYYQQIVQMAPAIGIGKVVTLSAENGEGAVYWKLKQLLRNNCEELKGE